MSDIHQMELLQIICESEIATVVSSPHLQYQIHQIVKVQRVQFVLYE